KMIEAASGREFTPFTTALNRAETCVAKQFGHQSQLINFSRAIWSRIALDQDRSLHLSDIQAAAEQTSCSTQDALAVLALLSSGSVRLLTMEMKSTSPDRTRVSQAEFIEKLSDWWRDKKLSDADWERWASGVEVKWVPADLHQRLL